MPIYIFSYQKNVIIKRLFYKKKVSFLSLYKKLSKVRILFVFIRFSVTNSTNVYGIKYTKTTNKPINKRKLQLNFKNSQFK